MRNPPKAAKLYMLNDQINKSEAPTKTPALFQSIKVNAGLRTVTETELTSKTVYDKNGNVVTKDKVSKTITKVM